jgi:hypothetical protein
MRGKSFLVFLTKKEHTIYSREVNIIEIWHKRLKYYHLQRMLKIKKNDIIKKVYQFFLIIYQIVMDANLINKIG